jgi:hypothetical protein
MNSVNGTTDRGIGAGTVAIRGIRHAPDAPTPVLFAARELQRYLSATVGASLPIMAGTPQPGSFSIASVPGEPAAAAILGGVDDERYDHSAAVARDGCVWLVGENPISALFAVYDFLQATCGVRFFGPGPEHEHVPRRERLDLPGEGEILRTSSDFALRDYWTSNPDTIAFAVKNRLNMISMGDAPKGDALRFLKDRGVTIRGPGHIWGRFLPDKSLFATHPEYFPLIGGQRQVNGRTACFSNPEVRRIFFDNLRTYLRANPEWDIFAFWAEDTHDPFYCGCAACTTMTVPEWYLTLVNEAAQVLSEESPRTRLEFIAYHGTRNPPDRPMPLHQNGRNMMLDICVGYTRDIYRPLAEATGGNAEVYAMYRNWRAYLRDVGYQGHTMLMEYYNLCEAPNQGPRGRALLWPMETIREDTRFYRSEGLDALGDWVCMQRFCWPSPFALWTWLQLYSDCERTVEAYKDDFYPRYFGPVGAPVRRYMDALESAMHAPTTAENVREVRNLALHLDEIEALELQPKTTRRMRVVRLHHEYCVMLKEVFLAFLAGDAARWQALERRFRDYFEVTHRAELTGEIDIPPTWAYTWFDKIARREPAKVREWAANPMLR